MRRHRRFLFLVLSVLLVLSITVACAPAPAARTGSSQAPSSAAVSGPTFVTVSPQEAKRIIDKNKGQANFVILDVRTPQEFQSGHIDGAINIDFYSPDFAQKLDRLDKSKVYVVYCRSGHRSARAVALMKKLGFQKVYEIQGGVLAWQSHGLPLVR